MTWSEELYSIAGRDPALPALNYQEHEPLYTPASWALLKPAIHRTLEAGEPFSLELEMVRPDGSIRNVHALGRRSHDFNGSCIGLHGAVQDITRRKETEEALQMANNKLRILAGITRHDIQNKLMTLQGYLELTSQQAEDLGKSGYLAEIDRAAREIQRQIEFTRTYEELGMRQPVWQAVRDLISTVSDSGMPVEVDCVGYQVLADPMIEMVFANLMANTIRHAEGASRVTIWCEERDGRLAILWEDDGPGIPDDQKERIFERGVGRNTGFGLFLSREILSITGIAIAECGAYGTGAGFEILVPKTGWKRHSGNT
nr:PAS domain-containing sensor histidine kinase [Methanocalculus sp. AMF5]